MVWVRYTSSMSKRIIVFFLGLLIVVGLYHTVKPLPENVNFVGSDYEVPSSAVHFFSDTTYINTDNVRLSEQEVFNEIFRMIDEAKRYILIDMFFYSDFIGVDTKAYRYLSEELTKKLLDKKKNSPEITIQVIIDPINIMYGGHVSDNFEKLRASDITVIITDLNPLRDSNPIYGSVWRTIFQWWGNSNTEGWLPNPLDAKSPKLGMRTYLKMLNYKANHRKVVMTDFVRNGGVGFSTLITSANPHDGSSAHSNIAIRIDEKVWQDVVLTEQAVADFSGYQLVLPPQEFYDTLATSTQDTMSVQVLTEGAIKDKLVLEINALQKGDELDMSMFYISDRDIVTALKAADDRGVKMRLLLDPNKDAFGREKNGVPNRQVANELMKGTNGSTEVRWCNTNGEQCHSKMVIMRTPKSVTIMHGSANLTKRNIGNYNLETNVFLKGTGNELVFSDSKDFFEKQWSNQNEVMFSVSYEKYADSNWWRTFTYRVKEFTGLSRW